MRYEVREEKVAGTRQKSYAVYDANAHGVVARFSDKAEAERVKDQANAIADGARET
jgi:hypothetical protein